MKGKRAALVLPSKRTEKRKRRAAKTMWRKPPIPLYTKVFY